MRLQVVRRLGWPGLDSLSRIGARLVRWRKTVVVVVVLVGLLLGLAALDLRVGFQVAGFFTSDDPELRATIAHYDRYETPDNTLLFGWPEADPLGEPALSRLRAFAAVAAGHRIVRGVVCLTAPELQPIGGGEPAGLAASHTFRHLLVGRSGDALGGVIRLGGWAAGELRQLVDDLEAHAASNGIGLRLCGLPYHTLEAARLVRTDMARFLPIGTAFATAFLFWLVPNVWLALLALLIVPLTLLATLGTMALSGVGMTMLTTTLPTLLLCMSIADGVHMVGRFCEERRAGHAPADAAVRTFAAMFWPCLMTSLTTIVGFLGLCRADLVDLRQLGWFAALGMGYAFVFTMALLPAVMSWVSGVPRERRHDPLLVPLRPALWALRLRPGFWLCVFGVVFAVGGAGACRLEIDHRITADLWDDSPEMVQMHWYQDHFVGIVPAEILVERRGGFGGADALRELAALRTRIEAVPSVDRTLSLADLHADGVPPLLLRGLAATGGLPAGLADADLDTARILAFRGDLGTRAYRTFLAAVEGCAAEFPDLRVRVVGTQRIGTEQVVRMTNDLAGSFFGSLLVILGLVWLQCRDLRLAFVVMASCLVPLVAVLGGMAAVGATLRPLLVIAFCIALGLLIDDAIHLAARWQEERRKGLRGGDAVHAMLTTAGRPVVTTTVLLLVGFATILSSEFRGTFAFGALVAIALIGAFVSALVLLPALLRITERR